MYCPSCKAEFVDGISLCNDCEVPLVAALPEQAVPPPLDLATVANYPDPISAELAADFLRAAGFEVHVSNEHVLGLNWLFSAAVGGVSLTVASHLADEARQVLASMEQPPADEDEPDEFAGGHVDPAMLEHSRRVNAAKVLLTLFLTSPILSLAGLPFLFRQAPKAPAPEDRDS